MKFFFEYQFINNFKIKYCILLLCFSNACFSQGINCSKTETIVEKSICNNIDLLKYDAEIAKLYSEIKLILKNKKTLKIFKSQHSFWLRERNNCQNQDTKKGNLDILVYKSLLEKMSTYTNNLKQIKLNPGLIMKNASNYKMIDPWYFLKFQKDYIGKNISIFGWIEIPDSKKPKYGILNGDDKNNSKVNLLFKNMPEEEIMFIERTNPASHHDGKVVLKDNQVYLYMTDILGVEL